MMSAESRLPDTVLVTGAGYGIGEAAARHFAGSYSVACLDIDCERALRVAEGITEAGGRAIGLQCDVSQESSVARAVAQAAEWGSGLSVVISNAGIVIRKSLLDTTVEEWDRSLAVNLRGAFLISRAAVPYLAKSQAGVLLFVTSVVAHIGFGFPAYTASKGGLIALVRELAGELAHLGIRVNGVSPGTVSGTGITTQSLRDPEVLHRTVSSIPLGRLATVHDVVAALSFLASPSSSMITGHLLVVDGGVSASVYTMQNPSRRTGNRP
jgi:NAD(P)-dependent dehydrogenase (short-subunit alcohol dehydrogenase family)